MSSLPTANIYSKFIQIFWWRPNASVTFAIMNQEDIVLIVCQLMKIIPKIHIDHVYLKLQKYAFHLSYATFGRADKSHKCQYVWINGETDFTRFNVWHFGESNFTFIKLTCDHTLLIPMHNSQFRKGIRMNITLEPPTSKVKFRKGTTKYLYPSDWTNKNSSRNRYTIGVRK